MQIRRYMRFSTYKRSQPMVRFLLSLAYVVVMMLTRRLASWRAPRQLSLLLRISKMATIKWSPIMVLEHLRGPIAREGSAKLCVYFALSPSYES